LRPEVRGERTAVSLVLTVEAEEYIGSREEARYSGDSFGLTNSFLKSAIKRPKDVDAGRGAVGGDFASDPRPIDESGCQGILSFAPSVGAEIAARKFENAKVGACLVKVRGGVSPIRRKSRRELEVGLNESASPKRGEIEHGDTDETDRQCKCGPSAPRLFQSVLEHREKRLNECGDQTSDSEYDERHDSW